MRIDETLRPGALLPALTRFWELSAGKIESLLDTCPPDQPSPVFTVEGRYTTRGWTEWTRGFQYGSALLQFDATGEERFLTAGRELTRTAMAGHLTHTGVHDHGFNNVSTYGNLWRLAGEGRIDPDPADELALKVSGAVQASRWQPTADGGGYIYSFNGPHSLFVDTIRSCRSLALAHQLGHALQGGLLRRHHRCVIDVQQRIAQHPLQVSAPLGADRQAAMTSTIGALEFSTHFRCGQAAHALSAAEQVHHSAAYTASFNCCSVISRPWNLLNCASMASRYTSWELGPTAWNARSNDRR